MDTGPRTNFCGCHVWQQVFHKVPTFIHLWHWFRVWASISERWSLNHVPQGRLEKEAFGKFDFCDGKQIPFSKEGGSDAGWSKEGWRAPQTIFKILDTHCQGALDTYQQCIWIPLTMIIYCFLSTVTFLVTSYSLKALKIINSNDVYVHLDCSSALQTRRSNYLHHLSTWMSNMYFKLNMSKYQTEIFISHPPPLLISVTSSPINNQELHFLLVHAQYLSLNE